MDQLAPEQIKAMADKTLAGTALSPEEATSYLAAFKDTESWVPYVKLLEQRLVSSSGLDYLQDTITLTKTFIHGLNDYQEAVRVLKAYQHRQAPTFDAFKEQILCQLDLNDVESAKLLKGVWLFFAGKKDQVACLEYLAVLYEKRLHDEKQLVATYRRILQVDAVNLRALHFFKNMHQHNSDWEKTAGMLRSIVAATQNEAERARVAHELASVVLYCMEDSQQALDILRQYCSRGSLLDTSTLQYDAYSRRENWQACIRVLENSLRRVSEARLQANVHFRIARIYVNMNQFAQAQGHLETALHLDPSFWEPIEELVHIAVQTRDWPLLKSTLGDLTRRVKTPEHREQLSALLQIMASGSRS